MRKSELPLVLRERMDVQEDYLKNNVKTWLKPTLLANTSEEHDRALHKLMSIFYVSNSVTREILTGLQSRKLCEHTKVLIADLIDEQRHTEAMIDLVQGMIEEKTMREGLN